MVVVEKKIALLIGPSEEENQFFTHRATSLRNNMVTILIYYTLYEEDGFRFLPSILNMQNAGIKYSP